MKRGKKGSSPICNTLVELLKTPCPEGFYPWQVEVSDLKVFCYARTSIDAIKKTMNHLASATPCAVEEIIEASKNRSKS